MKNKNNIIATLFVVIAIAGTVLIIKSAQEINEIPDVINTVPQIKENTEKEIAVEEEIRAITETSNSTDISDLEADLNFDIDSSLELGEF